MSTEQIPEPTDDTARPLFDTSGMELTDIERMLLGEIDWLSAEYHALEEQARAWRGLVRTTVVDLLAATRKVRDLEEQLEAAGGPTAMMRVLSEAQQERNDMEAKFDEAQLRIAQLEEAQWNSN